MCDYRNEEEIDMVEDREEFVPDRDQLRYGGPQGDDDEDAKRKAAEREAKKAEVRKRLEEAGRAKKAKKGFLTPERKKKLRKLLMLKAAEDLKQQQLLKEQERQKVLKERIIPLPDVDNINDQEQLKQLVLKLEAKIREIEDSKWDLNYEVRMKDHEINELTIAVNDLRGKFVKPTLKKVSKYDNKFKKIEKKSERVDFKGQLKTVARKEFTLEDLDKKKGEEEKPAWGAGKPPAE